MKIGAAGLIRAWGRPMSLKRNGIVLVDFMGRKYEIRSHTIEEFVLDYSVDQDMFFVVVAFEDLLGYMPGKFDVVVYNGSEYTVQHARSAGADEDEIVRILVKGGMT